jgi:hypothetical protein
VLVPGQVFARVYIVPTSIYGRFDGTHLRSWMIDTIPNVENSNRSLTRLAKG